MMMPAQPSPASSGNAFVYILIACVLFGALTYSLTRSYNAGGAAKDISDSRGTIAANSILAYAAQAQTALVNLERMGAGALDVSFMPPMHANFNVAPTNEKLFHPDGGGLSYKPLPPDALDLTYSSGNPPPAFYIGRFNNYEWTQSGAMDIVFTAWGITQQTCAALNKQVIGTTAIPHDINITKMRRTMVDSAYHSSSNADTTIADCPSCDGRPSLCIRSTGTPYVYAFYSILISR